MNECPRCHDKEVKGLHIRLVQGNKSPDDKVVLVKSGCVGRWLKLSDLSLFKLIELRMAVEDLLYPPPLQGRHFLGECIDMLENGVSAEEVYRRRTERFINAKKPTKLSEFI